MGGCRTQDRLGDTVAVVFDVEGRRGEGQKVGQRGSQEGAQSATLGGVSTGCLRRLEEVGLGVEV